jgi:hypothetical protein
VGEDRVVGRMAGIGEFDGGVDEGAAANRRPVEPVVEDIETASSRCAGSSDRAETSPTNQAKNRPCSM